MIGILGALGFAMLKNPGTTAKYTAKAFGTGRDALRLGGKGLDKMGKYGDYTRTALKTGVGGYLGYQAGGMVGDFAADAYLAYEGDTESTQRTAASMRTSGRLGGALLGAGLSNAGAIMGGVGAASGSIARGVGAASGSIASGVKAASSSVGAGLTKYPKSYMRSRYTRKQMKSMQFSALHPSRLSNTGVLSSPMTPPSWMGPVASPTPFTAETFRKGRRVISKRRKGSYIDRFGDAMQDTVGPLHLLGQASNHLISRTVSAGFTAVEKVNDFLNGGMLELPGKFFAYANRGDLQVAPMLSLGGRASRVAKKPVRDGFLKKRLDPSPQGLRPGKRSFKTELGFGAAGLFASVPIVIGMESQMPSNKVSAEGNITGIGSSPRGGISPELQMSTQGLTLGIHNKRKSRLM